MYLMYLDDSGSMSTRSETHLILGGFIVHKDCLYWIKKNLNDLAQQLSTEADISADEFEFHASEIFSGRRHPWDSFRDKSRRIKILEDVLHIAADQCARKKSNQHTTLIACAVKKTDYPEGEAMKMAFEEICSRFQLFLQRQHHSTSQRVKGMIILDESSHETALQKLAKNFVRNGNKWGQKTDDILEVPLFVDSRASRGIQLADAVAYAVYRNYEARDLKYYDIIERYFDSEDGHLHGLIHKTTDHDCKCYACLSRTLNKKD